MAHLTLEGVLDLEDEFYKNGYAEGQDHVAKEQFLEGKIYGLQTGFQRFLIVGYMHGLLQLWKTTPDGIESHLSQLETILSEITFSNDDAAVARYESAVARARNKARVIASLTKTTDRTNGLDSLIKQVGGSLHVAENVNEW